MSTDDKNLSNDNSEERAARALLDSLLEEARLYRTSTDFLLLMEFVAKLRNFAPFNAMLLQIQRPGLMYAASSRDWLGLFNRKVKTDARPLLIMWPFGPVALVYDVRDTEGDPLPTDVMSAFRAEGVIDKQKLDECAGKLLKKHIYVNFHDWGDGRAGYVKAHPDGQAYEVSINRNHDANVQFSTLAHELGHLFLGHIGANKNLKIPIRKRQTDSERELEAESVAFIVSERVGIRPESHKYLSGFISESSVERLDIYQILRAAGQVESALELNAKTKFRDSKTGGVN